jgi:hypothetical protein
MNRSRFNRGFQRGMDAGFGGTGPAGSTAGAGSTAPPAGSQANTSAQMVASGKANRFWFTYATPNIASLAPAASTTNTILFDNDSSFEWTKLTVSVDLNNAAQSSGTLVVPLVTLLIQNTGAGTYYSNAPVPLAAYAGNWGLPYVMPAPQIIAPAATLQFTWASLSTSGGGNQTYNNLQVQLHGWKIYRS